MLLLFINSCKKELYTSEKIDPAQRARINDYLKEPKIQTISMSTFTQNVNVASLGVLKEVMLNSYPTSTGKLMGGKETGAKKARYRVNVDSAKLLVINGRANYIFSIAPISPRSVTFRNLTISKNGSNVVAFISTYTPTRRWARNYRLGKKEKFQGRIVHTPINLNDNDALAIYQLPTTILPSITTRLKTMAVIPKTSTGLDGCTATTLYEQEPYYCASGQHGPGDLCYLEGEEMAGYRTVAVGITYDCSGGGDNGGGGTTPGPPPGYNPCDEPAEDENTPGENQVPNMENDEPICDPLNNEPQDVKKTDSLKNNYPCLDKLIFNKLASDTAFRKLLWPFQGKFAALPDITYTYSSQSWNSSGYQIGETRGSENWDATVYIGKEALTNASQLMIAVSLVHETAHAYSKFTIVNGYYGNPIHIENSSWPISILDYVSERKNYEGGVANYSDHSLFLEKYFDDMVDILKKWGGANYTLKEYQMAALYGLDNAGTAPPSTKPAQLYAYNTLKLNLINIFSNIKTKYGITSTELNTFNTNNIINTPSNKKLTSTCP